MKYKLASVYIIKIDLVSYPAQAEGLEGGACGVMVIIVGNGHTNMSSNPV